MRPSNQPSSGLTLLTTVSVALFLSAMAVLLYDITYWLEYASWAATTLVDVFRFCGIPEPYFIGWSGAQEIWGFLRDAPLSILLLVIWFLFTGVAGSLFGSGAR